MIKPDAQSSAAGITDIRLFTENDARFLEQF